MWLFVVDASLPFHKLQRMSGAGHYCSLCQLAALALSCLYGAAASISSFVWASLVDQCTSSLSMWTVVQPTHCSAISAREHLAQANGDITCSCMTSHCDVREVQKVDKDDYCM
jgi:hypothetical protein